MLGIPKRDRAVVFALFCVAATLLLLWFFQVLPSCAVLQSAEQQQNTTEANNRANPALPPVAAAQVSSKPSQENCDSQYVVAWWTLVGAWSLIVVGVLQYFMFWRQLNAMRQGVVDAGVAARAALASARVGAEQVALAREDFAATHRPWVAIKSARAVSVRYDSINDAISVEIEFVLRNTGRTPALRTDIGYAVKEMMLAASDITKIQSEMSESGKNGAVYGIGWGYALFKGDGAPQNFTASITKEDMEARRKALADMKLTIGRPEFYHPWIFCCISYVSSTDNSVHQTQYVFQIQKVGKPGMGFTIAELPLEQPHLVLISQPMGSHAD